MLYVLYISTILCWLSFSIMCLFLMIIFKRLLVNKFWESRKIRDFPKSIGSYKLIPSTLSLLIILISWTFAFYPGMKFLIEILYICKGCYFVICYIYCLVNQFPEAFFGEENEEETEEKKVEKKDKKKNKLKQKIE